MSNTVLIIGESGSGKSYSLSNLKPEETFVINVLDKPLPFRGFKRKYIQCSEGATKGNYFSTDKAEYIKKIIDVIDKKRPDIKNIILDDFQYIMGNEFMNRADEKGYQKFTDIGKNAWSIIRSLIAARADLDCFVLSHSEKDQDGKSKCKTIGKMLDDKITLEGMFTVILHTVVTDSSYHFLTANNGTNVAKSPMGMFKDVLIENDLQAVKLSMAEYFGSSEINEMEAA